MPRVFRFPPLTPYTKKLLIALGSTFVVAAVLSSLGVLPVVELLALHPGLGIGTAWQVLTYVLVEAPGSGGVLMFFIGLVFLWLMMAPFEARFGAKPAMHLTVVSTLAAAVPFVLVTTLGLPARGPLMGPFPLFLGLIGAMYASVPRGVTLSYFGLFPMRPGTLVAVVLGISVVQHLVNGDWGAIFADFGAVGGGVGYVRLWLARPARPKRKRPSPEKKPTNGRARRVHHFKVIEGGGGSEDDDGEDSRPRWLN